MTPQIFIFTALPCEAKPLIQHWQLSRHPHKHPFTIFSNSEKVIVISGIGKTAMAGAVGYALALSPNQQNSLLINLGICGHQYFKLGSVFLADKIVDAESGKKFYPQAPFKVDCETMTVQSLAKPSTLYSTDYLYDLEASAFYEMACKFTSVELIHCLKIVSDNDESSIQNISEDLVSVWINQQLPLIEKLIAKIIGLQQIIPINNAEIYQFLVSQFHFTSSNCLKLKNLLQRWQLLEGSTQFDWHALQAKSAKQLLAKLEEDLNRRHFYL